MSHFIKAFAVLMLLSGMTIILEQLGIYSLNVGLDKVIIGAVLLVALQILNIVSSKTHNGRISIMSVVMIIVFIMPVLAYFFSDILSLSSGFKGSLPLIIGVMMLLESLYMLH